MRERELNSLQGAEPLTALPESEPPRLDLAQKFRLSGDFVSFDDLLALAPAPAKNRILARARFQASNQGDSFVPVAAVNLPSEASAPEVIIEVTGATDPGPPGPAPSPSAILEPNLFAEPTQPLVQRSVPRLAPQVDRPSRDPEAQPPVPAAVHVSSAGERSADAADASAAAGDSPAGRGLLPTFLRGALSRILKR
jgi:hypothetical protein